MNDFHATYSGENSHPQYDSGKDMSDSSTKSPSERRRAQLRDAQRRHRQRRQENTEELEQRVSDLQEQLRCAHRDKENLYEFAMKVLGQIEELKNSLCCSCQRYNGGGENCSYDAQSPSSLQEDSVQLAFEKRSMCSRPLDTGLPSSHSSIANGTLVALWKERMHDISSEDLLSSHSSGASMSSPASVATASSNQFSFSVPSNANTAFYDPELAYTYNEQVLYSRLDTNAGN